MPVFIGNRQQRGHRLGSVLESIFRRLIIIFFESHGKTLATDALKTGVNVADDVLGRRTLKESVNNRVPDGVKQTAQSLICQSGSGVRRRRYKKKFASAFKKHFCMMAFAHDMSCECTKSELDLFSVPPTQTSMEHSS